MRPKTGQTLYKARIEDGTVVFSEYEASESFLSGCTLRELNTGDCYVNSFFISYIDIERQGYAENKGAALKLMREAVDTELRSVLERARILAEYTAHILASDGDH